MDFLKFVVRFYIPSKDKLLELLRQNFKIFEFLIGILKNKPLKLYLTEISENTQKNCKSSFGSYHV